LWNGECCSFFLQPDDRITLVTGADEIAVIDPLLLQEFDSGHCPGADEQEDCAARYLVICFGQCIRIVWWSIRRAAPDDPMNIDVSQPRQFRVSRIHAPDMTSERDLSAAFVVRVIEVVVSLRVGPDRGVINFRRQGQRCATTPATNQFSSE